MMPLVLTIISMNDFQEFKSLMFCHYYYKDFIILIISYYSIGLIIFNFMQSVGSH